MPPPEMVFRDRSGRWPHTWVKRFSGIVPVKAVERPGAARPAALEIALLVSQDHAACNQSPDVT